MTKQKPVKAPLFKDFPVAIGRRVLDTNNNYRTDFFDQKGNVIRTYPPEERQPYYTQKTVAADGKFYRIEWEK